MLKKGYDFSLFLVICFFSLFFTGCIKTVPKVYTAQVTEIEPQSAKAGGNVTSDGREPIDVRGVCWSTRKDPSISGPRTTDGYGEGAFTSILTGLTPKTLYYVRAYATNKIGTGYGSSVTFTTADLSVPVLTTIPVSAITQTTAVSGGDITFDGGTEITERGVCWSTTASPDIADSKTSNGTGTGTFQSNITGLTGNTRYYLRAYATNSVGTGYGQEISFTSGSLIPTLTTTNPSATGTTTGASGGNITNDGGSAVTTRGVCWNTAANPTTANSKTSDGTGTGTFSSTLSGLIPNTRYHVRAYATNSVGTAYGADLTFFTDPVSVQDFDNNTYSVIRIGTQLWTKENLKTTHLNDGTVIPLVTGGSEWNNLTTPGYCWYSNNIANKDPYGALYNWHSVNTGKLCPTGWHVPSDNDWLIVENYLGGSSPAGGKMKEALYEHWTFPNTGADNQSNFTALPGGWRSEGGTFEFINNYGFWWTSTGYDASNAWFRRIQYDQDKVFRSSLGQKKYGMSIRCLKD